MKIFCFAQWSFPCSAPCPVFADEGHHHEELTETQLGTVHFPVSCAAGGAEAVRARRRAVALLLVRGSGEGIYATSPRTIPSAPWRSGAWR